MIDHISVAVNNFERSLTFYDATLSKLMYDRIMTMLDIKFAAYGIEGGRPTFEIKQGGRVLRVSVDDIYYIKAEGNYVALHTNQKRYMYRLTMNAISQKLNQKVFLRIHRSFLLNTKYILRHRYLHNNEFEFQLKNGEQLLSSKSYKEKIQAFLANDV